MIKNVFFLLLFGMTQGLFAASNAQQYIINNNIEALQIYIANGGDINSPTEQKSPLLVAVLLERTKIAQLLLQAGAKIEYSGVNIFAEALKRENLVMAEVLLQHGANINAKGYFSNNTLLYDLLLARKYKSVIWLLEHKAPFRTKGGLTPFGIAVSYAPLNVIEAFMQRQTDINTHDDTLGSLLALAISLNRDSIAERLITLPSSQTTEVLCLAIERQKVTLVKQILHNKQNDLDYYELWNAAISANSVELLQVLLDSGIDLVEKKSEKTLLYRAMSQKKWEALAWLLEHLEHVTNEADSFFYAIRQGDIDSVKTLLEKEPSLSRQYTKGYSTLLWALKYKQFDIASILVDFTADLDAVDEKNESALFKAITYHQNEIVSKLLEHKVKTTLINNRGLTPLYQCVRVANYFAFNQLLDLQKGLVEPGLSVVYLSVERGLDRFFYAMYTPELAKLSDDENNTLLHKAAYYNRENIVRMLVLNKSDIEATNNRGETPLIVAAKEGSLECATLLTHFNANQTKKDLRGYTAHNWAEKNNHLELGKWLSDHAIKKRLEKQKREDTLSKLEENNTTHAVPNPI